MPTMTASMQASFPGSDDWYIPVYRAGSDTLFLILLLLLLLLDCGALTPCALLELRARTSSEDSVGKCARTNHLRPITITLHRCVVCLASTRGVIAGIQRSQNIQTRQICIKDAGMH